MATTKTSATGTRGVAQRIVNAEERFIEWAQECAALTRDQAIVAFAAYRKAKVVRIDPIVGQFELKHGAFADVEVLRRAGGVA